MGGFRDDFKIFISGGDRRGGGSGGEVKVGIKWDLYIMYMEQNCNLKDLATTYTEKPMIHRRSYPVPAPLESKKQSLFLKIDLLDCSSFSYPLINKSRN